MSSQRRPLWQRPVGVVVVLVLAVALMTAGVVVSEPSYTRQSRLERIGDRYEGVIERVNYDSKAPDLVVVSFERAGRAETARLSADDLHSGSEVTVLVDPEHPDQITLEGHRQQSALAYGLTLLLLVTGTFVLLPIACLMIVQVVWRWRHTRSHRHVVAAVDAATESK